MRTRLAFSVVSALFAFAASAACGGSSSRSGFTTPDGAGDPSGGANPAPSNSSGDFGNPTSPPANTPDDPTTAAVYGHSATTLYKLDPDTKAVTTIGDFNGCSQITDIALDGASTLYATTYGSLYTVDKTTAHCTLVASGTYPNSLSFVPKGTLDPNAEALVGYNGGQYVRIDTKTGAITNVGSLGGSFQSSGDVVSVNGGSTYLTVKDDSACSKNDCLVEISPATGAITKNWGSIGHVDVFGLSFWGGDLYGFDNGGQLFQVSLGSTLSTAPIAIPSAPKDLSFWGAGSTTAAPLTSTPQ